MGDVKWKLYRDIAWYMFGNNVKDNMKIVLFNIAF